MDTIDFDLAELERTAELRFFHSRNFHIKDWLTAEELDEYNQLLKEVNNEVD